MDNSTKQSTSEYVVLPLFARCSFWLLLCNLSIIGCCWLAGLIPLVKIVRKFLEIRP